MEEQLLEKTPE